jgi:hypothetical protein
MFKLQPSPTFWAPVPIPVPGEGSKVIELEFSYRTRDEAKEFHEWCKGKSDDEIVPKIVVGWRKVDVPFGVEHLIALLNNYPGAAESIGSVFWSELGVAKRKN